MLRRSVPSSFSVVFIRSPTQNVPIVVQSNSSGFQLSVSSIIRSSVVTVRRRTKQSLTDASKYNRRRTKKSKNDPRKNAKSFFCSSSIRFLTVEIVFWGDG